MLPRSRPRGRGWSISAFKLTYNLMSQLKETQSQKQIIFGGRFILKKFSGKIQHYNIYHGVDLETREQVTAYVKLVSSQET